VSSGNRKVHRLSRRGNRRLNHAIHMAAVTQIRDRHSDGRACYDKKICTDGVGPALLSPDSAPVRWLLMDGYVYDIRDDQDHPPWQEGRSLRRCYSLLRSFKALHRLRAAPPTRRARAATGQTRRADVPCGTGAEIGGAGQDRRPGRLCQARLAAASRQCRMTAPDA